MIVGGVLAQATWAQAPEVRNIQSAQEGEVVTITYDLRGEKGETYTVRFLLSTDGGETYDVEPQAVSGAVGPGVTPGSGKRISWRVQKDFPEGLPGAVQYRIVASGGDGGRAGAVWRSALVPGLGQFHQGQRTRGWLYVAATGLALSGVAAATLRHQNSVDDYNAYLENRYTPEALAALSETEVEQRSNRLRALHDDAESAATLRTVALAVLGGVWAVNVIDSAWGGGDPGSPPPAQSAVHVEPPRVGYLPSDDAPTVRVSLRIRF